MGRTSVFFREMVSTFGLCDSLQFYCSTLTGYKLWSLGSFAWKTLLCHNHNNGTRTTSKSKHILFSTITPLPWPDAGSCHISRGVCSIVGERVEVLQRIPRDSVGVCLRWILVDPFFVRPCSCVYRLDPSDLRFSSSTAIVVLVRWFHGALARQRADCLLQ